MADSSFGALLLAPAPERPTRPAARVTGERPSRPARPAEDRPGREPWVIAAAFFGLYLAVAAVLVLHFNSIPADAMSRVANGSYVFRGADPHLAAVGFVWNPLPSILAIPLLLAGGAWPALLSQAFAGNILSAAVMALCVAVLNGLLRDLGLRRASRLALTLLFGLTPMIVYYGANGMSEAYLLLAQVVAVRALLSWTRSGASAWRRLVVAGAALGFGYFTRYEALVTAAGAVALVALVAFGSAPGPRAVRLRSALADSCLIGLPAAAAFAAWAGLSWITVGRPFEQFSSSYGNSSQVVQQGINGSAAPYSTEPAIITGLQLATLEPLLVVVGLLAAVMLIRRRDAALLVPFACFVPVLAFQAFAAISGGTFGWWRFYIDAIPLTVVLLGLLIAARRGSADPGSPARRHPVTRAAVAAGAALVLLTPFASQALAAQDGRIAKEEKPHVDLVLHPDRPAAAQLRRRFENEHQIAAYLDAKQLPPQSILVDVASGFAIVLASRRPESFVITPDRQFRAALDGIGDNQVQYILDVPNEARGLGTSNAVNVKYPSFYRDGGGVAVLDREFPQTSDQPPWRLYRVIPAPEPGKPARSGPSTEPTDGLGLISADERDLDKLSGAIIRRRSSN